MATRGNRPKNPASTKGGVRGTHGLGDAASADSAADAEERNDRNLATETVPGPGPKDENAGRATKNHLETHRLEPESDRRR